MAESDVEMVIHPVRLRILQTLQDRPQTTQDIAEQLVDVPKSSLYRHLKLLRDSDFITVAETRLVQGIQEKVYRLNRPARLGAEDIVGLSAEEHLQYFTTYLMVLLRGFSNFLAATPEPDFVKDRAGYSEVSVWATEEELDSSMLRLNEALQPLIQNEAGNGRRRHKIAIITFPERERNAQ
ncbi:MAG: helix-turn-helix domain-containing protein [Chloroflexota bacterium]|jgi:DNA-binding transcriptional ArsR family regulator